MSSRGVDGGRTPKAEQSDHLSKQCAVGVLMFLKIFIFSQFRFFMRGRCLPIDSITTDAVYRKFIFAFSYNT
jgi:hypothetical protein